MKRMLLAIAALILAGAALLRGHDGKAEAPLPPLIEPIRVEGPRLANCPPPMLLGVDEGTLLTTLRPGGRIRLPRAVAFGGERYGWVAELKGSPGMRPYLIRHDVRVRHCDGKEAVATGFVLEAPAPGTYRVEGGTMLLAHLRAEAPGRFLFVLLGENEDSVLNLGGARRVPVNRIQLR